MLVILPPSFKLAGHCGLKQQDAIEDVVQFYISNRERVNICFIFLHADVLEKSKTYF